MSETQSNGRMNVGVAVLLAVIAIAFLSLQGLLLPHGGHRWSIGPWSYNPFQLFYGMLGITFLIQLVLAVWVGIDAQKQGHNGFLWGILVFFTPVIGLIVYLLLVPVLARRNGDPPFATAPAGAAPATAGAPAAESPPASATCPACRAQIEADFKVCPVCGNSLRCAGCDKPIRGGWKVCPYCATPIASSTAE